MQGIHRNSGGFLKIQPTDGSRMHPFSSSPSAWRALRSWRGSQFRCLWRAHRRGGSGSRLRGTASREFQGPHSGTHGMECPNCRERTQRSQGSQRDRLISFVFFVFSCGQSSSFGISDLHLHLNLPLPSGKAASRGRFRSKGRSSQTRLHFVPVGRTVF